MKVDFFIIGGQKCGTTALHSFLINHPQIKGGSKQKELDFFAYEKLFNKGLSNYHSKFNKNIKEKILLKKTFFLDSSPSYLLDENPEITSSRIYEYNAKGKVIVLVRNPIERSFSAFQMYKKRYFERDRNWWVKWVKERGGDTNNIIKRKEAEFNNFNLFIKNEICAREKGLKIECPVLKNGEYSKSINLYRNKFKSNFLLIQNEEMHKNTTSTLVKVSDFLNIKPFDWSIFSDKKVFEGSYHFEVDLETINLLKNYYQNDINFLLKDFNIDYR
ncbi:sulfotransferase domain-containing protein [Winogradskyella psychrotolerans]|uniref:sulfotransferase domain-containing protein n=1 Tax=Winogradskyella psychrotolerans TaxID=1344585 RepID=UPI001C07A679|nr:sulfotransferase domain-containing protein [Winogradskyella psychrotolerans]MBU2919810.1 sulfotransferase domain-containing protein [Winogradskyella psychrotolerans]